jgi:hypothetical protein
MYRCFHVHAVPNRKMPPSSADPRKQFILTTTGNFFGLTAPPQLADSAELNNFLDDGNEFVLCFSQQQHDLHPSNQVDVINLMW